MKRFDTVEFFMDGEPDTKELLLIEKYQKQEEERRNEQIKQEQAQYRQKLKAWRY